MQRYKLIIFDWDGTLVDSTSRIVDSMQQAAREVGLPSIPDKAVKHIIGLGLPEAIRTLWPNIEEQQLNELSQQYARLFVSDSSVEMSLYTGAKDFLKELMLRGFILAVATGKSRKGLDRMMREMKLGHLFAITRCADETHSKPDPLMLNEILESLGVAAHEALMVGDTSFDLDMANAANVDAVAMSHGAHDLSRLQNSKPVAVCHNINELRDWIITNG